MCLGEDVYVCLGACWTWHVRFPHTLRSHVGVEAVALRGDILEVVHREMFAAQACHTRVNVRTCVTMVVMVVVMVW